MIEKSGQKGKILKIILAATLSCALAAAGIAYLYACEYFFAAGQVDNLVGMLPVALTTVGAACGIAVLWLPKSRKNVPLACVLAATFLLSAALLPRAQRADWWMAPPMQKEGTDVDISVYEPFREDTAAATLDGKSALLFGDGFPVVDGALALYPLYSAFVKATYKECDAAKEATMFTNTLKAYDGIISGERDVIFVAGASKKQLAAAKEKGVTLEFTPIGKEAFVFVVGKTNPVDDITYAQIRNIYSGKTAKWSTLGWKEGGNIIAFQRPEGSGSQTGLQNIMGDLPIIEPQPLPDKTLIGENSLMKQVSVEYRGVQPALGYSYRFFAETMCANPDTKLLKVNGIEPNKENIASGEYPFTAYFYAVTNGKPEGNTKLLIDWILSEQGAELIEKTGYVPL